MKSTVAFCIYFLILLYRYIFFNVTTCLHSGLSSSPQEKVILRSAVVKFHSLFKYCLWKWPSKVTNRNSLGFLPSRTFVIHLDKLQVMCRHKRLQLSNLRLRVNTPPTVCSPVAVGKSSAGRSVRPIESSLTHRGAGEETGGGPGWEHSAASFCTADQSRCSCFVNKSRRNLNSLWVH